MATAVLFMWDPKTEKVTADSYSTPETADPVRRCERLKSACEDDFPGAIWSIGMDEDARDIMATTRMREMGFEDYDHAEAKSR